MSGVVPYYAVEVNENFVPGAALPQPDVRSNKKPDLQRFLSVRGVKNAGLKKADLVSLVYRCIADQTPLINSADGGISASVLRAKNLNEREEVDCLDLFPVDGWKQFPSRNIPEGFSYDSIYHYLITTARVVGVRQGRDDMEVEEDDLNGDTFVSYDTKKPLKKGRIFFKSGNVQALQDNETKKFKYYCVKSSVLASFQAKTYKVCIMLSCSGSVIDASCECVASAMGRCSHVAGVLFAIEDYTILFGFKPPSCTSQLCSWNQGRKAKNSTPIYLEKYSYVRDPKRVIVFRPVEPDEPSTFVPKVLYRCEAFEKLTAWELLLEYKYEDYDYSPEHLQILQQQVLQLKVGLQFGFDEDTHKSGEVPRTSEQSGSVFWKAYRRILITASVAHRVVHLKPESVYKFVKEMVWYPQEFTTQATQYGMTSEKKARQDYISKTKNTVLEAGLFVNPNYPGLGASPDGIVICPQSGYSIGLVEIKCPFVIANIKPQDFKTKLDKKRADNFCLEERSPGVLTLKKKHQYYTQIQMQMGVVNVQWTDFVVWSKEGIFCERIPFCPQFWNETAHKLLDFHSTYLCPEYFEMRIPRKLPLIALTQEQLHNMQ